MKEFLRLSEACANWTSIDRAHSIQAAVDDESYLQRCVLHRCMWLSGVGMYDYMPAGWTSDMLRLAAHSAMRCSQPHATSLTGAHRYSSTARQIGSPGSTVPRRLTLPMGPWQKNL